MSPVSALQKLKQMSQSWDSKVIKWKEDVCKSYLEAHPPAGVAADAMEQGADHPPTLPDDPPSPAAVVVGMDTGANNLPTPGADDPLVGGASDNECLPLVEAADVENQVHCFYKL